MFSVHNSNEASAPVCNAKSSKTLEILKIQASFNHFCTLLQQLPQDCISADFELLLPHRKRLYLLNRDLNSPFLLFFSSSQLKLSLLQCFLPFFEKLFPLPIVSLSFFKKPGYPCKSITILPSSSVKKRRKHLFSILLKPQKPPKPLPKKKSHPCKATTALPNQKVKRLIIAKLAKKSMLAQKIVQGIKYRKHSKVTESTKERKLCEYTNRSKRYAREYTEFCKKMTPSFHECYHFSQCFCQVNKFVIEFVSNAIFQKQWFSFFRLELMINIKIAVRIAFLTSVMN